MMRFHLLRIYVTVIGFCVILTMPIAARDTTGNTFISSDVEEEIQRLVTDGDIPSLQVGVVFQDLLVWTKGYGLQPSLDTVYMIGSIQKTITATSVLQLYERGVINDLEDDINDYLPFKVRNPDYPTSPITIRMLLSHRSGLVIANYHTNFFGIQKGHSIQNIDQLTSRVSSIYR